MITEKIIKEALKENDNLLLIQHNVLYEVVQNLYNLGLDFIFDLDYIDSGDTVYVQATVYIENMIGKKDYSIIFDSDVKTYFKSINELVAELIQLQKHALDILKHFDTVG